MLMSVTAIKRTILLLAYKEDIIATVANWLLTMNTNRAPMTCHLDFLKNLDLLALQFPNFQDGPANLGMQRGAVFQAAGAMSEMRATQPRLKPCPFCGGQAERVDINEGENAGGSCICCTYCLASSNVEFGFKENFIDNWNRRAKAMKAFGGK